MTPLEEVEQEINGLIYSRLDQLRAYHDELRREYGVRAHDWAHAYRKVLASTSQQFDAAWAEYQREVGSKTERELRMKKVADLIDRGERFVAIGG